MDLNLPKPTEDLSQSLLITLHHFTTFDLACLCPFLTQNQQIQIEATSKLQLQLFNCYTEGSGPEIKHRAEADPWMGEGFVNHKQKIKIEKKPLLKYTCLKQMQ